MDYTKALAQVEGLSHQSIKYLSAKGNLEKIGKVTAISVATYVVVNKLYDAFCGPLSSLDGPFLTRFINVPKIFYDWPKGTWYKTLISLHDKYGDTVRLGPRYVSISDKEMLKQALVTEDLPKGPLYEIFRRNGQHTMFSTNDSVWHKKRRRIISPAFSIKYLKSLEPFMVTVSNSFIKRVDHDIAKEQDENNYGTIDIWKLAQYLALDVIGETAFGQTFNMIENNDHFVPNAIAQEVRTKAISASYPLLSKLFIKNHDRTNPELKKFMTGIVNDRLQTGKEKRNDILQHLINCSESEVHDDRLTFEAIMSETVIFLVAGSETSSNTIGFTLFELLSNPEKLERLHQEIDSIELEENQSVFRHEQVKNLPYLNAVINETLRLNSAVVSGLERITEKPTVLGQLALPKDVRVICNVQYAQITDENWPNPFEFKPERWIESEQDKENPNDLEAHLPFSAGSRSCIGKNFALQEIRIALASFMKNFDIAPIPQEMEEAKNRRDYITFTLAKGSFKIKAKRRE